MKILLPVLSIVLLQSCTNSPKEKEKEKTVPVNEKEAFFPVSSYLKGQIVEIIQKGINPIKYTTVKDHTDSIWLKTEELNEAFKEFLHPEIDSANLITLFSEKKFMDRSIDAFTFTYDAIGKLPDSMTLSHWDVYVDPNTENVKRIYMLKNISPNKTLQLTWQSNKWCKLTTIVDLPNGTSAVEKEERITWNF